MFFKRNLGLDIARALAISLVIISHSRMFFNYNNTEKFRYLSICGVLGVEIFFVLSGFLIGKILINTLVETPSLSSLKTFYIRRWFRTLPLYYLSLLAVKLTFSTEIPKSNFVFLQNFNIQSLSFYDVSWSLSIEEWFYLLFPILLIIFINLFKNKFNVKYIFFFTCILILVSSFVAKAFIILKSNPTWDFSIRKSIFLRMDSLMIGVIWTGLRIYYKDLYMKISKSKITMLLWILGFTCISILYINILGSGRYLDSHLIVKIFFFPTISFFSSLMIISLAENKNLKSTLPNKFKNLITYISMTSYGMYLIHWIVFRKMYINQGFLSLIISLSLTVLISFITFKFYETPIMNLRDKFK